MHEGGAVTVMELRRMVMMMKAKDRKETRVFVVCEEQEQQQKMKETERERGLSFFCFDERLLTLWGSRVVCFRGSKLRTGRPRGQRGRKNSSGEQGRKREKKKKEKEKRTTIRPQGKEAWGSCSK